VASHLPASWADVNSDLASGSTGDSGPSAVPERAQRGCCLAHPSTSHRRPTQAEGRPSRLARDVADYRDADQVFGTLADAVTLLTTDHNLGLKVIMDLVPNRSPSDASPGPDRTWLPVSYGALAVNAQTGIPRRPGAVSRPAGHRSGRGYEPVR
jgi:hypothetical protein